MTQKELAKLSRQDLLALLVAQGREAAAAQAQLEEVRAQLAEAEELGARLRARLDEKDGQIEHLKEKLNAKDAQLVRFVEKLNEKDAQLDRLRVRLGEKDHSIDLLRNQVDKLLTDEYMQLDSTAALGEVTLKLNLMLRTAQKAVDRYLHDIQRPSGTPPVREGITHDL